MSEGRPGSASWRSELARIGFTEFDAARAALADLPESLTPVFAVAADADQALRMLVRLGDAARPLLEDAGDAGGAAARLIRVLGASAGLADFLIRVPAALEVLRDAPRDPLPADQLRLRLRAAVAGVAGEDARTALRRAYRTELLRVAVWDLTHPDPVGALDEVARALADLAGAALEGALDVARAESRFPAAEVADTRLAIIGMGKAGARELNYVSDVDVVFVGGGQGDRALEIATRLAMDAMRVIQEPGIEPVLWQVDANLRPEGKDGALVRSLDSHLAYYDRWAKNWEFQALLKARPLAGDRDLGNAYVEGVAPKVWASSARPGFVEQVQRMRERVTEHIPRDEVDHQLKLGPGGLRDVEFTIQLLQLVHGAHDDTVHQRGTLPALAALADGGYIGRVEAGEFSHDYRLLRLLEHRLQLARLSRTHLMPRDRDALRVLGRATGLFATADQVEQAWQAAKLEVRGLHERLFYRPLLSAVAALPEDGVQLTSSQAAARLAAIGFGDPEGALRHIAALTAGVSRRATIQRTLLPVLLLWFAEGPDPDHGLLAFRRLSDDLGETYWFLRMLRDSSGAARDLTTVLSGSRYVVSLMERIPEAAAWLADHAQLRPRPAAQLLAESRAIVARHEGDDDGAALALRTARRREVLRLALAGILGVITVEELGRALSDVTTALLQGALAVAHRYGDGVEFGIVAMGRYGGAELGFGSDADVIYVCRDAGAGESTQRIAEQIVRRIGALTEDLRLPFELDADLRPEGRNGAIVRSLDSYRAYYQRWSLTWEAQALLRARPVAGEESLLTDFIALADTIRYPAALDDSALREIRRIKARVEAERLPRGADPARHLKLGRGSLSDVEWLVQTLQLQHAHAHPELRTTSTLDALQAEADAGLLPRTDAARLRAAWLIAARARSAMTLWTAKTADVLPIDRWQLEGVARLLEYPPGSASALETDYLRLTRQSRAVFERLFFEPAAD